MTTAFISVSPPDRAVGKANATAEWTALLLTLLLSGAPAWAIDTQPAFADARLQERYLNLTQELRCLVCQNQTIADSNADLAGDLRRQVREMIAAHHSDEEILQFMTDRYGDFVLYRPPVEPRTWLLWTAPALFLAFGLAAAILVIRRKALGAIDDDVDGDPHDDPEVGARALTPPPETRA